MRAGLLALGLVVLFASASFALPFSLPAVQRFEGTASYSYGPGGGSLVCPHEDEGRIAVDWRPTGDSAALQFAFAAPSCGLNGVCRMADDGSAWRGMCLVPDVMVAYWASSAEGARFYLYTGLSGGCICGWGLAASLRPAAPGLAPDIVVPVLNTESVWRGPATLDGHPGYTASLRLGEEDSTAVANFVIQDPRGLAFDVGSDCSGAGSWTYGWRGECGVTHRSSWTLNRDGAGAVFTHASGFGLVEATLGPVVPPR